MVKRMVAEHTVLYVVISVCTLGDQCISLLLLSQFGLPRFNSGKFQHISKRENFYILNVLYWYSNVIIYA